MAKSQMMVSWAAIHSVTGIGIGFFVSVWTVYNTVITNTHSQSHHLRCTIVVMCAIRYISLMFEQNCKYKCNPKYSYSISPDQARPGQTKSQTDPIPVQKIARTGLDRTERPYANLVHYWAVGIVGSKSVWGEVIPLTPLSISSWGRFWLPSSHNHEMAPDPMIYSAHGLRHPEYFAAKQSSQPSGGGPV